MRLTTDHAGRVGRRRAGVSLFQVTTLLCASGLGVWLGARSLGVPVENILYGALDQSTVLERLPEEWRPQKPECPTGDCADTPTPEERAAQLRSELNSLRLEVAAIRLRVDSDPNVPVVAGEELEALRAAQRDATVAYWARIREVAAEVDNLHDGLEPALTGDTAGRVIDVRRRAFDYGARAILGADTTSVDPQAVEGAHRVAQWYQNGRDFYAMAADVWEGRMDNEPTRSAEAALAQGKTQHDNEVALVREKNDRLASVLSRRYAVAFQPLGI